jgi:predicted RecB family nuclease
MKITAELFAAFLKCPLKCWLLSRGARVEENPYAQWLRGRGATASRKAGGDEKLLLAFDALARGGGRGESGCGGECGGGSGGESGGAQGSGSSHLSQNSRLSRSSRARAGAGIARKAAKLFGEVRERLCEIEALLAGGAKAPELVLNRHCVACEFHNQCRQKALEQDNLSLLAGMGARERGKLRARGIFTVTQLSHTFQPRRKPKWLQNRAEKYHHSLKALAIREQKIHLVGRPALKIDGTPVYLDVEGMPDSDRYYLIGARIGDGADATQHSFWADADTDADEKKIWREFLALLDTVARPVLVHYGRYEKIFLKRMRARHGGPEAGGAAARAMETAVNLVAVIFARIYFPTYSNGLKEIARYLGHAWASPEASGTQAVVWRDTWTRNSQAPPAEHGRKKARGRNRDRDCERGRERERKREREKARRDLLAYNADDCAALALVTWCILDLAATATTTAPIPTDATAHPRSPATTATSAVASTAQNPAGARVVDAATLKRQNFYGFKRNQFFYPELNVINKAAYWDYQREKVYVKSDRRLRRALQTAASSEKRKRQEPPVDRHIECEVLNICPHCAPSSPPAPPALSSPPVPFVPFVPPVPSLPSPSRKYDRVSRIVYDLEFTRGGLRRRVTQYHYHRHQCLSCGRVYRPQTPGLPDGKFGASLIAYSVYQNIELRMSHEMIDRSLNELFDLRLARGSASYFKSKAAQARAGAHDALLLRLRRGGLLHVDETKISVAGFQGCVWAFASIDTVAYIHTRNRESEWLKNFLADFRGVLVTDFYSGYDALPCVKQRCLVHFLRDLNDDLFKHPYDEDFKRLGRDFAGLVRPIIAVIEKRGLKARHLKKHRAAADRFFRALSGAQSGSAIFRKYQARLARERGELFTFLSHDGVPWNNNNAEHAVKAFALLRHVINGVTSENGLREYLVLLSLCETCKYLGVKFLDFLRSGQPDVHEFAGARRARPRLKA